MAAFQRIWVLFVVMVCHSSRSFAEPLTDRGEPITYCPGKCGAESLAWAAQFDRTLERCEDGDAEACFNTSTMRMGSPYCCAPSLEIDRVWALKTMKKACDLGHDEACWQFYVVLTPWMDNLAKDNAQRGCDAGVGYACHVLGSWPLRPNTNDELQRRACALGDPNGCALAYVNVACGTEKLPGVSREDGRAKLKYSCSAYLSRKWEGLRARDMGAMVAEHGCTWLADGLKMGWGGPTDWQKARWLDHYVCRESGRCSRVLPFGVVGGVAMAGEAFVLGLGLLLWRLPGPRSRLEKKLSPMRHKVVGYLGQALLALLCLQVAYCAWGAAAWLGY